MTDDEESACDRDEVEREMPEIDGVDVITPNPNDAELMTSAKYEIELTERQDFDVHTAVTQGLASYLTQLDGSIAGRSTRFVSVLADWADVNDTGRGMPTAAVHSEEIAKYEITSGLAPGKPIRVGPQSEDLTKIAALTCSAIYALDDLMVETWCDDKVLRAGVRRMLEDAFSPVQWMSGFRLMLPRYHSAICVFSPISAQLGDSPDVTRAGLRPLTMRLRARCPVYKLHRLPAARPRVSGSVTT